MTRLRLHDDSGGDAYLWDRSGPVDAEVARLEGLLRPMGYRARPSHRELPISRPAMAHVPLEPARRWALAAAAMIGLAMLAAWMGLRPTNGWRVEPLSGSPTLASRELEGATELRAGQWLRTDERSSARLEVVGLGDVRIEPGSRLRVKEAPRGQRLLDLREGTIHAFITAPPRVFLVDTPAARAVDMGCEYALSVDETGTGRLRVFLGYVQLEGGGRVSTIPMDGGECSIRSGFGPGTPFFGDASEDLKVALQRLDFGAGGDADLSTVLEEARGRDGLTLWHLLSRTSGEQRARVYDRLASLKPPPATVTRQGVLALDATMLDRWWDDMRPF